MELGIEGLGVASQKLENNYNPELEIDSHQHFWKFDPVRHAWIDSSMQNIAKDFLPKDLNLFLKQI